MQLLCSGHNTAVDQGNLLFILIRFILSETSPSSHDHSAQARLFSLGTCMLRVVLQLATVVKPLEEHVGKVYIAAYSPAVNFLQNSRHDR